MAFIHAHWKELGAAAIILLEQILPLLPIKADSTAQLIINIGKTVFAKKV